MVTFYLAIASLYALYFHWLISTDAQATMHAYELADANKHSQQHMSVNDYFFDDNYKD